MKNYFIIAAVITTTLSFFACESTDNEPPIEPIDTPVKVSILGDSYSTFRGYNYPRDYSYWYPDNHSEKGFTVSDMWWHILCERNGWGLYANNSWSGATICHTGFDGQDYSNKSFVTRVHDLGAEPDIIFVFGGINDCWAEVPLGEKIYSDWTTESLYDFRPALSYVLHNLQSEHPNATVFFICNDLITDEYRVSIHEICSYYSIKCIDLYDIDKIKSHPTFIGMMQIADQISETLTASDPETEHAQ